jgi:CHAT domain-containing protein/Tfp pilus assembly protein PilF
MRTLIIMFFLLLNLAIPVCAETSEHEIVHAQQLNDQAVDLYSQGKYQDAISLLKQALDIREKTLGPFDTSTFASVVLLAFQYETAGQYESALPLYKHAIEISEKSLDPIVQAGIAVNFENLARVYLTMGKYEQALPLYKHALELEEKDFGQEYPSLTVRSIENLAGLHQTLGHYDQALALLEQALAINEKDDPSSFNTAKNLNDLADLYQTLGQQDKALLLYQRVLAIRKTILDPQNEASLNNLAVIHIALGQYEQALPLYESSLLLNEAKEIDPANTSTSLSNLASLYVTLGKYEQALPHFQRALEIREKYLGTGHVNTATSLVNLAELYKALGQDEKVLPLYLRACRAALFAQVPDTLKVVFAGLGDYYAKQNKPAIAIFYLKSAVNTMQAIRAGTRGLDQALQRSLLNNNAAIYRQLAGLLVDAGRLSEAQQVMVMLKEDEYFDFIRRDLQSDSRKSHLSYSHDEQPLASRLEKLGWEGAVQAEQFAVLNRLARLGLTKQQEEQRTLLEVQIAEHAKLLTDLLNEMPLQLRAAHPTQKTSESREKSIPLRTMLKSLGHGVVLLNYIVTEKKVRIILTTPKVQLAREAVIPAKELNRKIAEFRRVLQNPSLDPRPQAQALYQLLIAPVTDDLKLANAKTLMVSLDGSLRYLPMGALYDSKAYLAERYPLAMYTEVAKDKLREKPEAQWKVAGLGITHKIGEFAALPSVQQELDGIIYVGSHKSAGGVLPGDIYVDKDFDQARFHDVLDRAYPVIHIASHFVFIPGTEAQSFLLLGDGKQLSLAELRTGGWKFDSVDMMTLSACETALGGGQDENGREIEGFGALVQRQGAKGVLATLWPVADQSTAILMQTLYRLRQENSLTKAEALREAQLALITGKHALPTVTRNGSAIHNAMTADAPDFTPDPNKPFAHPYYWAPFVLMGNWL